MIRRLLRDERGLSLTEVIVTAGLLVTVSAIFLPVMNSIQTGFERQAERSGSNDGARLALEQLDREIRSASVVYDPVTEPGLPNGHQNYVLRLYTSANAPTRVPPEQCVRWAVRGNEIQRQSYQVINGAAVLIQDWRTVASGIANKNVTPPVPPFSLDSNGRTVHITFMARATGSDAASSPVRIQTSVALRNSSSADPCTPVPVWSN